MPSIFQVKAIAFAIIAGIVIFFIARYSYLQSKVEEQANIIATKEAIEEKMADEIKKYESAKAEHHKTINEAQNENAILRHNIDSGATKLRVKASCPSLPKTADTTRAETADPELDREVRQDYFDLRQGIIELESRLKMCVNLLEQ